jgi:zinc transport system substrate-binding protein
VRVLAFLGALGLALACDGPGSDTPAESGRPLVVFAVNQPLADFAARIGGAHVAVTMAAPAGTDPADWRPDAEQVAAAQAADLLLLQGAGYAPWVARATLDDTKLVDTTAPIREQMIREPQATTHQHGPEGAHSHAGLSTRTWLDPSLAAGQAAAIEQALVRAAPQYAAAFAAGRAALDAELAALDERLRAATADLGETPLIFSHPVYDYLIRRCALDGVSLHWEPDEAPTASQWADLEALLAEHPARVVLFEAAPLAETGHRLEALGLSSRVLSPCGGVQPEGDSLTCLAAAAATLDALSAVVGSESP